MAERELDVLYTGAALRPEGGDVVICQLRRLEAELRGVDKEALVVTGDAAFDRIQLRQHRQQGGALFVGEGPVERQHAQP